MRGETPGLRARRYLQKYSIGLSLDFTNKLQPFYPPAITSRRNRAESKNNGRWMGLAGEEIGMEASEVRDVEGSG
jgi:hypothetical protein